MSTRVALALAALGCSASHAPGPHAPPAVAAALARSEPRSERRADAGAVLGTVAVASDAGIESAETAWLVTHLADDPDPARGGESDAARRLARRGAEGVRAVVEVFRVGDPRRTPFARRVIETVALQRCHHDRLRAARLVAGLQSGPDAGAVAADAGFLWSGGDDTRWPAEALGRVFRWVDAAMPCETSAGMDGGPAPG